MEHYIRRSSEEIVMQSSKQFPAVALTDARQSGKTTLFQTSLSIHINLLLLMIP